VTISSWLNFGHPVPPGRGSAVGCKFLALPNYSQRAVFASLLSAFSFANCSNILWLILSGYVFTSPLFSFHSKSSDVSHGRTYVDHRSWNVYRQDALCIIQPTASKHWRLNCCNMHRWLYHFPFPSPTEHSTCIERHHHVGSVMYTDMIIY